VSTEQTKYFSARMGTTADKKRSTSLRTLLFL